MILVDVNVLFYSTLSPEIVHAWGDHHILIDLYTVFPIGKRAIIFKLHTFWGSNCTLIQPIRSACASNLMNHIIAFIIPRDPP